MKKRKNIAIPMILAATIAAVSVPCSSQIVMASDTYQVGVSKGYLALRSAMAYDSSNEIGELYSGDTVEVTEYTTSDYWYVYSPKLNKSGYVNNDYLYFLSSQPTSSSGSYTVSVAKGYLALRSTKAYDSSNEIGQLYSGDTVTVSDSSDPQYWYVYSPKLNLSGYVNKDYLYYSGGTAASAQSSSGDSRTVSVAKGYLALRSAKAYDSSNEIGQLYSGDTVQLIDTSDSQYWYVYSQKLGKNGYVNKDYLIGGTTTYATRTVSVATGYLALRSAKAYDSSNEIGQLYSGDTVQLVDTTDAQYWYVYSQKLCKYGYVNKAVDCFSPLAPFTHASMFLFVSAIIGLVYYKKHGWIGEGGTKRVFVKSVSMTMPSGIAVIGLVIMSKIMDGTGQTVVLANGIANVLGKVYIIFAPFVGLLGTFMTGSNMSSNILFGSFQMTTAKLLGANTAAILGAQSAGGAIGAAISPSKIILGTTTASILGSEGEVMKKLMAITIPATILIGAVLFVMTAL